MQARIGIDTGGTFTDIVRWSRSRLLVHKVPSTPADPGAAVLAGLQLARRNPDEAVDVVHGTTVGLNAVLTGSTARVALVTNAGFEDLIEIGRQERSELYALAPGRPVVPVPRELRFGVPMRQGPDGAQLQRLTARDGKALIARLRRARPAAIAIGLLHSPADPRPERDLQRLLQRHFPDLPITASSELCPTFGEFERFCAAILNAGTVPLVGAYLGRLRARLGPGRLRLLRSSLGILPEGEADRFPARAMFSGPAGGVLATRALAARAGLPAAAAFDMGGTSTDVCLVHDRELLTQDHRIAGLPLPLPSVDVHTVGCGGGSIAFVDRGGSLRVGPRSAGAHPGPACYGVGDEPTVTDAHVALGHLGEHSLLGGGFPIDVGAAVKAIERLGRRLGLDARTTAEGILTIADVHMARALMVITVERAVDPVTVPLLAYGGAGGLHAAALARRLGMPGAIVPPHPGAFSAVGLCLAGESFEQSVALRRPLSSLPATELRRLRRGLLEVLDAQGRGGRSHCWLQLRYSGQGSALQVPWPIRDPAGELGERHRLRYGFVPEGADVEVVGLHVRRDFKGCTWPMEHVPQTSLAAPQRRIPPVGGAPVPVRRRADLGLGTALRGPLVIEETTGATWLPAGTRATVTHWGIRIHIR